MLIEIARWRRQAGSLLSNWDATKNAQISPEIIHFEAYIDQAGTLVIYGPSDATEDERALAYKEAARRCPRRRDVMTDTQIDDLMSKPTSYDSGGVR